MYICVPFEKFRWCFFSRPSQRFRSRRSSRSLDVEAPSFVGLLPNLLRSKPNIHRQPEYRRSMGGRIFVKGTTGLLWLRSCVSSAQHGHDLAASSSSTDVRRSYLCAVLALVLVQRAVGRLLLRFRGRSRWYFSS